jgi:sterol desaturase/sphingolipid hydroxylase (fatty acid hydroxylase superfamily)
MSVLLAHYQWQLSLLTAVSVGIAVLALKLLLSLIPTFRHAHRLNRDVYEAKAQKPAYAANQQRTKIWGSLFYLVIFVAMVPFCVTLEPQSGWRILRDVVAILMLYDLVYYLTHRFVFHDGGPLLWMHGVHHRQHDPCRMDSSYIHPLEVAIGLALYAGTMLLLSFVTGPFHVATVVVTWVAFTEINLHNHDRWENDRFPFRYLGYSAKLHHHHHVRFTGGNFATISPLYDWMFGTLDEGAGYKAEEKTRRNRAAKIAR